MERRIPTLEEFINESIIAESQNIFDMDVNAGRSFQKNVCLYDENTKRFVIQNSSGSTEYITKPGVFSVDDAKLIFKHEEEISKDTAFRKWQENNGKWNRSNGDTKKRELELAKKLEK